MLDIVNLECTDPEHDALGEPFRDASPFIPFAFDGIFRDKYEAEEISGDEVTCRRTRSLAGNGTKGRYRPRVYRGRIAISHVTSVGIWRAQDRSNRLWA